MAIPALTQLPLFVLSTIFFQGLTSSPSSLTGLKDENFLTLTSLTRPDATATLPIALGLVTLGNVETANWFVGVRRAARETEREEKAKDARQKAMEKSQETGERPPLPLPSLRQTVQGSLRLFAIARIVIGVMVDGVRIPAFLRNVIEFLSFVSFLYSSDRHRVLVDFRHVWSIPDVGIQLVGRQA